MRRSFLTFVTFCVVGLAVAACSGHDKSIDAVKTTTLGGKTYESIVNDLAGAKGEVDWSATDSKEYKDAVEVTAKVDKAGKDAKRSAQLTWLHNPKTQKIELIGVTIDGQQESLLTGAIGLLQMTLE